MISNPGQVYLLTEKLVNTCQEHGYTGIAKQLREALWTESSALEILGKIRMVILQHIIDLQRLEDRTVLDEAIRYIDQVFGRE